MAHIIKHLKNFKAENPEASTPLPMVSLVEGKKEELHSAHLSAQFLVGHNSIYAHGFSVPKPQLPMLPNPDLSVIHQPMLVPPGQEGPVQSLNQHIQCLAAVVTATDNPMKLVLSDLQPTASAHKMALQSTGM
jgi:hypothetical protein